LSPYVITTHYARSALAKRKQYDANRSYLPDLISINLIDRAFESKITKFSFPLILSRRRHVGPSNGAVPPHTYVRGMAINTTWLSQTSDKTGTRTRESNRYIYKPWTSSRQTIPVWSVYSSGGSLASLGQSNLIRVVRRKFGRRRTNLTFLAATLGKSATESHRLSTDVRDVSQKWGLLAPEGNWFSRSSSRFPTIGGRLDRMFILRPQRI